MSDFDFSGMVTAITDLATIFLVTIPSIFINQALNGGILWSIFQVIFDTPEIFYVAVFLSLVGGVWFWLRSMNTTQTTKSIRGKIR